METSNQSRPDPKADQAGVLDILKKSGAIGAASSAGIPSVEVADDSAPVRAQPQAGVASRQPAPRPGPASPSPDPLDISYSDAIKFGFDPVLNPALRNSPGGMGRVMRGKATICSIYPDELSMVMLLNGLTTFTIPAAPRGKYSLLDVYDAFVLLRDLSQVDSEVQIPRPKAALQIAKDLVDHHTSGTIGDRSGHRIGVRIIEGDDPTPEELAGLHADQLGFADFIIGQAHAFHNDRKYSEIKRIHRIMARFKYGDNPDPAVVPWFISDAAPQVKKCVACRSSIDKEALVCKSCQTNLVLFWINLGIAPVEEEDPVVHQQYLKVMAAKEAAAKEAAALTSTKK